MRLALEAKVKAKARLLDIDAAAVGLPAARVASSIRHHQRAINVVRPIVAVAVVMVMAVMVMAVVVMAVVMVAMVMVPMTVRPICIGASDQSATE